MIHQNQHENNIKFCSSFKIKTFHKNSISCKKWCWKNNENIALRDECEAEENWAGVLCLKHALKSAFHESCTCCIDF